MTLRTSLAVLLFFAAAAALQANPFLGTSGDPEPPRAVLGGGTGPLTRLQFEFRDKAADLLGALKDDPSGAPLAGFLLAAFVYGILHGAGPGHRKTIVFSVFLTRRARSYEPLAAGFLSAGLHAGAALAVIAVYFVAERGIASLAGTSRTSLYLEGLTFLLLVLLAAYLVFRKVRELRRHEKHSHGDDAGGKSLYSVIIVSSLIPCPGATMIMLFSLYLGMPLVGSLGVIAMSLGMGIVISAAGYLAMAGRHGLFARIVRGERGLQRAGDVLEIGSYLFILAFSLFMAWPFLLSLL